MLKKAVIILAVFFGVSYGYKYILSDDFQIWADREAAPWTCQFNNLLSEVYVMWSNYSSAENLYRRTMRRCPKSSAAETALYKLGNCIQNNGKPHEAIKIYQEYIEKYPKSERAKIVANRISRIRDIF